MRIIGTARGRHTKRLNAYDGVRKSVIFLGDMVVYFLVLTCAESAVPGLAFAPRVAVTFTLFVVLKLAILLRTERDP